MPEEPVIDFVFVKGQDLLDRENSARIQLQSHGREWSAEWWHVLQMHLNVLGSVDADASGWTYGRVCNSCNFEDCLIDVTIIPNADVWDEIPYASLLLDVRTASARLQYLMGS